MEPLLSQLDQLGPWGVVLGAALIVLAQRLGLKLPGPLAPPAPKPEPVPTPVPVPVPPVPAPTPVPPSPPLVPNRPILDGLLKVLLAVLESQAVKEGRPVEAVVAEAVVKSSGEAK